MPLFKLMEYGDILDISMPVDRNTAFFPQDTPFRRTIHVTHADSQVMNLSAFTMSPHVGTHADAPIHIQGEFKEHDEQTAGQMPLIPFMGPAVVIDITPEKEGTMAFTEAITPDQAKTFLEAFQKRHGAFPKRILFKTRKTLRYDVFEDNYAWLSAELIRYLAHHDVLLVGLDTPSVDRVESKTLETHHVLLESNIRWLENLALSKVKAGEYMLIALPLKMMELEASPVRAVLLSG